MSRNRVAASHVEWLSLVDTTGTFLTVPVMRRVFPAGLDPVPDDLKAEVRRRLADEPVTDQASATVWLGWVLKELLGLTDEVLLQGPAVPDRATHVVPEHGLLRPEYAVAGPDAGPDGRRLRMLVLRFPYGTSPDQPIPGERWAAPPLERAVTLVRATGVPLVMATDGDWFGVAASPPGGGSTTGTWASSLFGEEPTLLASFHALLSARRFFSVDEPNTLAALFAESVKAQEEVTSQLGDQVRQAVELLVGAFSRANRARGGELLDDVTAEEVYAAALTCMMRLVFLLYAEERDLLPARQELYRTSYGVLGLRQALRDEADRQGEEALERRSGAWQRLLATFRVVHGGVEHESMRLPGYGGGLFDPDRYPFLEGRRPDEPWRRHASRPLPVDDRTMLAVLEALQVLRFRDAGVTEARPLSYRSLDVEQIGHVYEGLLDHGATMATDVAVGLVGKGKDGPEVALTRIEDAAGRGRQHLLKALAEATGRSEGQLQRDLDRELTIDDEGRLRSACEFDDAIADRVRPFLGLLVRDLRGLPTVYLPGSVYVTKTTERRDTGTQYTPKDLADEIVRYALEPLVYEPGPAETADVSQWRIKAPERILALRVCDPAVGSGAILVAACRYLSERLIEAAVEHGPQGVALDPRDQDVALVARRLVVDHCLYGVDRNPIAAEMAKLSLWLVTLARERPFTFLDHAIQVGDSLLGITSLDQVRSLHLDPDRGRHLMGSLLAVKGLVDPLVDEALDWITQMRGVTVVTVADAEEQRQMQAEADRALERVRILADAIIGKALVAEIDSSMTLDERVQALSALVQRATDSRRSEAERIALWEEIRDQAEFDMNRGAPVGDPPRRPMHWPLSFPEVFHGPRAGFNAVVGNPPFLGGKRISGRNGDDYRGYLRFHIAHNRPGSSDLVAYFFLRASELARDGFVGFLSTNSIAQGDTRVVGLDALIETGRSIYRAVPSRAWPGQAAVSIALVWLTGRSWSGSIHLSDQEVSKISAFLQPSGATSSPPRRLQENANRCFYGTVVSGEGFILTPAEAEHIVQLEPQAIDVIKPYLAGVDVNGRWDSSASRLIIDFQDWPLERAEAYPVCLSRVRELVKPQRDAVKREQYRRRWWQFAERSANLYKAIGDQPEVIVVAQVSNTLMPALVPSRQVFSSMVVTFTTGSRSWLAVLSSSLHTTWVRRFTSTLQEAIRYTPTACFEPFPMPRMLPDPEVGQTLIDIRLQSCRERRIGLTELANLLNDPKAHAPDIRSLRDSLRQVDLAVLAAYGWDDIRPKFDHYPLGSRLVYGPDEESRRVLVERLWALNHERYAVEQASPNATGRGSGVRKARRSSAPGQLSLTGRHG